jgi:hypothetical protein
VLFEARTLDESEDYLYSIEINYTESKGLLEVEIGGEWSRVRETV